MIDSPQRGYITITPAGQSLLARNEPITNALLAKLSSAFLDFYRPQSGNSTSTQSDSGNPQISTPETPQETFERVYNLINEQLADELLNDVLNQSPVFFEHLVVDLMKAMGYGDGLVTKYSGDDGIDGIIHEDKLGFNLIYIQAKRWKPDITITKPELQKFAGAMMGPPKVEKGLFITTAKFSPKAKEYATAQHIILVDGKKLTELMIEYGVGVSTQKAYLIKRIDSDYFSDDN
jgi:restriction system protein